MSLNSIRALLFGTVRRQLIVGVATVHAVMMSLFVWDLTERQHDMQLDQQAQQATALASSMSTSAATWLAARDLTGVQEIVEAQQRYPELLYAMAVDRKGLVLAHTDRSLLGRYLTDLPAQAQLTVLSRSPELVDVVSPAVVADQPVGWVRVGVGQRGASSQLAEITRDGILYALAAILIGAVLAGIMGARLTRKLRVIQKVTDGIGSGKIELRAEVAGDDEAARLAHQFNRMLDTLLLRDQELLATQELLRDSGERLQLALDGTNDGLWDWNIQSNAVYFSPRWKAMLGYGADELADTFEAWEQHLHPEDRPLVLAALRAHFEDATHTYEPEFRMRHKNGAWVWIQARGRVAERSADGLPLRMLGTHTDIGVRKHAEDSLRQWETVFLNAGWGVALVHPKDNRLLAVNPAFAAIHGYRVDEMIGMNVADTLAPQDRLRLPEYVRIAEQTGRSIYEAVRVRKDGNQFPCLADVSFVRDASGIAQYRVVNVQDITERKRAEQALRESEERLRFVEFATQDAVYDWDMRSGKVLRNQAYQTLYSPNEPVGVDETWWEEHLFPEDRPRILASLGQAFRERQQAWTGDYRFQRHDGLYASVIDRGYILYDAEGKAMRMIGAIIDITERKQAEESRRQLSEIVERSLNEIYVFDSETLKFRHVNQGALKNLEYTLEQIRTMTPLDIKPEFTEESFRATIQPLLARERELLIFETVHRRADGSLYPVEVHLQLVEDQNEHVFLAVILDITERKQAESALREKEQDFEAIVENLPLMVFAKDAQHLRFVRFNRAGEKLLGVPRADMLGKTDHDFFPPAQAEFFIAKDREALESGKALDIPEELIDTPRGRRLLHTRKVVVHDPAGQPRYLLGISQDITERKQADMLLQGEKMVLEMMAHDAPMGAILEAVAGHVEVVSSDVLCSILLLDADGQHLRHGAAPSLPEDYNRAIDGVAIGPTVGSCGTAAFLNQPVIVADIATDPLWADFSALALAHGLRACWSTPVRAADGRVLATFAQYYRTPRAPAPADFAVIERMTHLLSIAIEGTHTENALRESEAKYRSILTSMDEGYYEVDLTGTLTYANPGLAQILGYPSEELLGANFQQFTDDQNAKKVFNLFNRVFRSGENAHNFEVEIVRKDGSKRFVAASAQPIHDANGKVVGFRGLQYDITERKQYEQTLAHQALHDTLTDLPNRYLLNDRLTQAILAATHSSGECVLLALDIDNFKELNDTLGHATGDTLLKQFGSRLQGGMRTTDTLARSGGDEFAIVLHDTNQDQAEHMAHALLEALSVPFNVEGTLMHVNISIGMALYPRDGTTSQEILRRADVAMYAAKHDHSGYTWYAPEHKVHTRQQLSLSGELQQAFERDEFTLYYQPMLRLRDRALIGMEALARWRHPTRGVIPAPEFIPLIERRNMMRPFTLWAIEYAARQAAEWRALGLATQFAVNLTPQLLRDELFVKELLALIGSHDYSDPWLELEMTENALMDNPARVLQQLRPLRACGVRLSIDDFGTGYSSLAYLREFQADTLKIDRSFVYNLTINENSAMVVRAIIQLAHNLGIEVVAEGIENQETCDRLRAFGCDAGQGYYFGRPMPAADCLPWVDELLSVRTRAAP